MRNVFPTTPNRHVVGQLIPVHSSNSSPCFVFFPEAISQPASVFRTPIMPSWSVSVIRKAQHGGNIKPPNLHSPESMSCAMGLLPDVTYRVDTPLATSGCFNNPLSSALSWTNLASCVLISRLLLPALSSLITSINQTMQPKGIWGVLGPMIGIKFNVQRLRRRAHPFLLMLCLILPVL
jgi:hypothetical protein